MAPTYKLTYFNVKALAEPIRLTFAYAGISYEDIRLEREKWGELKSNYPWGSLPVLEVDGQVLAQSKAILRFLGNKFGLAGENDLEAAKCDEILEAMQDLWKAGVDSFHEKDEEKKKEKSLKLKEETFPFYFGKFNEILEKNGGFLVGKKLSYADLSIASFLQLYSENLGEGGGVSAFFQKYPALIAHQEKVFNTPNIKAWVEKRPKSQW